MNKEWTKALVAATIDHTLLKATATEEQIRELCAEARLNHFASVCVNPKWVRLAAKELSGSAVSVCTVIGFPLGATATEIKAAEAKLAVKQGADELDMVIDLGSLKSGDVRSVEDDIRAVVKAAGKTALVKVIIETCFLTDAEKRLACQLAEKAGARFVKTSTGYGSAGATREDVVLMRSTVSPAIKVKASGGVRTCRDATVLLEAGADRIGTSAGVSIISELMG